MTEFGGPATPVGGGVSSAGEDHQYALWDASYVLGSLSTRERHAYEAHLSSCASCREAVAELSGMPALLSRLDRDEVAAIDDGTDDSSATPPMPPELLTSLLAKVRWRRRRLRLVTWTLAAAAAAVVLVVGVFVALRSNPGMPTLGPPQAESGVAMTQVTPNAFTAMVSVTSQAGGTAIEMSCTYGQWPAGVHHEEDQDAGDKRAMVVVGRDGSHDQVASWVAHDGTTARPRGHTSMPVEQIAAIRVVSADTGQVYLQRNL
ncbi:anti-sigma factor family protein [Mycobacterium sp.]|uniref:anti-sigma factor family protein n=1 Tax=Mycobacterium sp. TaxID=1785 RepID=UPI003C72C0CD